MKRMLVLLAIIMVFSMGVGPCATTACKDGATVISVLQAIANQSQAIIDIINVQYPGVLPPTVQKIKDDAQKALDTANLALQKVCPTVADVPPAQAPLASAVNGIRVGVKSGTLRLGK